MTSNGRLDVDEGYRLQYLLGGAGKVDVAVPVLRRAADALLRAGDVIEGLADGLADISRNVARAVSDTTEMKRHLKAITDREQVLRRELDTVKAQWSRSQRKPRKKKGRRLK